MVMKKIDNCGPSALHIGMLCALAAASLGLASCAGLAGSRAEAPPERIAARVNGVYLTEKELGAVVDSIIPRKVFHGGVTDEKRGEFREQAMEKMIEDELMSQEAKALGMKVPKERIDAALKDLESRFGGEKGFLAVLGGKGLTKDEYVKMLEKGYLAEDFARAEITNKVSVADDDIRAYYDRHKEAFRAPDARRIRHIFIPVDPASTAQEKAVRLKRAEEVIRKLGEGVDFETLAWDYSEDQYKFVHGDLGMVARGRLDKPLDIAAFGLPVGKHSGIIETIYGYHILRVEAIQEPRQLSLDEVKARIAGMIKDEALRNRRAEVLDGIFGKADVFVFVPYKKPAPNQSAR